MTNSLLKSKRSLDHTVFRSRSASSSETQGCRLFRQARAIPSAATRESDGRTEARLPTASRLNALLVLSNEASQKLASTGKKAALKKLWADLDHKWSESSAEPTEKGHLFADVFTATHIAWAEAGALHQLQAAAFGGTGDTAKLLPQIAASTAQLSQSFRPSRPGSISSPSPCRRNNLRGGRARLISVSTGRLRRRMIAKNHSSQLRYRRPLDLIR